MLILQAVFRDSSVHVTPTKTSPTAIFPSQSLNLIQKPVPLPTPSYPSIGRPLINWEDVAPERDAASDDGNTLDIPYTPTLFLSAPAAAGIKRKASPTLLNPHGAKR